MSLTINRFAAALLAALSLACAASAVLSQDAEPQKNPPKVAEDKPGQPKEQPKEAPGADQAEKEPAEIRQAPKPLDPREYRIGELIEDLSFTDVAGKQGRLSDYKGKPLVVAVTTVGCPICKKYAPTLVELTKELAEKNVGLLLLNPQAGDEAAAIKDAIERYKFTARYVIDAKGEIAAALRVSGTADCFLLDAARTLVYRGAVDDQYGIGYAVEKPRANHLRDAVACVLAGLPVYAPATWAPGCALEFKPAAPREITWHNRVSRIVEGNCQECHRNGENGPFELMTLADIKENAPTIKRVVKSGAMPPWFAGKEHGQWHNDRSLSERDKADLLAWIEGGFRAGDEKDAPAKRQWPEGWRIGKPDEIVKNATITKVPAKGTVKYQYTMTQTDFGEDRWAQAMEIRVSAPQVVHHVLIFLKYPKDHPRANEQPYDQGGITGYFMGMVPGQGHIVFPPGQGKFIPKGASMTFQVHYTPNGEEVTDQVSLALIWCKERPEIEIKTVGIANPFFEIPAGNDNFEVPSVKKLSKNVRVLSFMPHMHVRGKAYRFEVQYPDGRKETLLDVPRFDFNWQLVYILREPIDLPKGSKIMCTGWFDNSDKNPANPDPKKKVRFGEQTWEEMQIGYVNLIELPD